MKFFSKKKTKKDSSTKKQVDLNQKVVIDHQSKKMDEGFYDKIKKEKKVLIKSGITKEELVKELEKYYNVKKFEDPGNPFKTREDVFITFYFQDGSIERDLIPFEEVKLFGNSYFINKTFDSGRIIINEMYYTPQSEINPEEEYRNKENLKKQLYNINQYLLKIKNEISKGNKKYELVDTDDLTEEKIKIETKLESIKYGKFTIHTVQHPTKHKKTYMMTKINGTYRYRKWTEKGFNVVDHTSRSTASARIIKDTEIITNRRKNDNFKNILISIIMLFILGVGCVYMFKLITFQQEQFNIQVREGVEIRVESYMKEISYLQSLLSQNDVRYVPYSGNSTHKNNPSYNQPK